MLATLIYIGAVIGALTVIVGGFLAVRSISKRLEAIGEAVLGKPEVLDFSGAVIEPAVPSIPARVTSLENLMRNGDQESRITSLESWRESHTVEATEVATRLLDHISNHGDK